ncbi:MAG: hypothetical protein OHK0039_02960 [Bacteroidia bacterium]
MLINTLEVRGEMKINEGLHVQATTGLRLQHRNVADPYRSRFLAPFVQEQNRAFFVAVGGRLINPADNRYDFPFIAFDLVLLRYDEIVFVPGQGGMLPTSVHVRGWQPGATATIGFDIYISKRWRADLALQMGYAPPRKDLLEYYAPGMGYSTFGRGIIGVKGGHIQPQLSLKYNIIKDKRQIIREMD